MGSNSVRRPRRYRLYIDESGDHTYGAIDDPGKRYLGLTGCFVEQEHYRSTLQPGMEALKQKHFPHSPDEPVIFHRKDIINRKGPFWRLRDEMARIAFDQDLLAFLLEMDYLVITVVIDKKAHTERYGAAAFHPYNYCLAVMLERYCGFLNYFNARGDVMAEGRGKKEDRVLEGAYHDLLKRGTRWRNSEFFRDVLTSKDIKIKLKKANIAGLQLADIIAYPSKHEILAGHGQVQTRHGIFGTEILKIIKRKYNRHLHDGRISGYGKVFL